MEQIITRKKMLDRLGIAYRHRGDDCYVDGRFVEFITDGVPISTSSPDLVDVFAYLDGHWTHILAVKPAAYSEGVGKIVRKLLLEGKE